MIEIEAVRGAGDRSADTITEPLLTQKSAALERARNELDRGELSYPITIECRYQPGAQISDLVRINDASQGEIWIGRITSIEHRGILGGAITALTVERPG